MKNLKGPAEGVDAACTLTSTETPSPADKLAALSEMLMNAARTASCAGKLIIWTRREAMHVSFNAATL